MKSLSRIWLFATPWTVAHQAPPSMGVSRQEYWSGVSLLSPCNSLLVTFYHFEWKSHLYLGLFTFLTFKYHCLEYQMLLHSLQVMCHYFLLSRLFWSLIFKILSMMFQGMHFFKVYLVWNSLSLIFLFACWDFSIFLCFLKRICNWFFKKFIYLTVPGLSHSMWDLVSWPGFEPRPLCIRSSES